MCTYYYTIYARSTLLVLCVHRVSVFMTVDRRETAVEIYIYIYIMHNMTYYSTRITTSEYECSLNYNSIHEKYYPK